MSDGVLLNQSLKLDEQSVSDSDWIAFSILNQYMREALTGRISTDRALLEKVGLTIPCSGYFIALFSIHSMPDNLPLTEGAQTRKDGVAHDSTYFIQRTLREVIKHNASSSNLHVITGFFAKMIVCVFSVPSMPHPEQCVRNAISATLKFIQENLNSKLYSAFSPYFSDATDMNRMFEITQEQLKALILVGTHSTLVCAGSFDFHEDNLKDTFLYHIQVLGNLILSGRMDRVTDEVRYLISHYLSSTDIAYEVLQSRLESVKCFLSEAVSLSTYIPEAAGKSSSILRISSTEQLSAFITQLETEMSSSSRYQNSLDPLSRAVMYIRENYPDAGLDVEALSAAAGISKSQLQRLFGNGLNTSVAVYISRVRIDAAKELLVNTNQSLREIAAKTGFNNDHTFARNFEKYVGVLPSDFRKKQNP